MKKLLPYILIIVILVGLFSPMVRVDAQPFTQQQITGTPTTSATGSQFNTKSATEDTRSEFKKQLDDSSVCLMGVVINVGGCLVAISYYIFYVVPSWLLTLSAIFFNSVIAISLSSTLYAKSIFVSTAWTVVRDLANIFFILILLYVAIQTILGMGQETKKVIVRVIIMALLINFSIFFTKIVIDTSNILALVFYNKLDVQTSYTPVTKEKTDRDLSGAMVNAFNPTSQLTWENFFKEARQPQIGGLGEEEKGVCQRWGINENVFSERLMTKKECEAISEKRLLGRNWEPVELKDGMLPQVPPGIMIGLILVTGAIMLFAAYAFFIAGFSFVGRLIELWILIIFSPFAFMSWTIPKLAGVEYLGWDAWFKRLIATSFMAPIFMFFIYLIFMLINAKLFGNLIVDDKNMVNTMLLLIIPAVIILAMLKKATEFAKKGGGEFGEMVMKGAKTVGGLATMAVGGAALGGAAVLGRATLGRAGAAIASSETAKRWEREGKFGSTLLRSGAKAVGTGSFDVRGVKIAGKDLAGATGMSLGEAQKGGFTERKEEQVKKRQERAKELQVGENEPLKQALNKTEMDLQGLLGANAQVIETLDKVIEKKRQEVNDAEKKFNAAKGTPGEATARASLTSANGELDLAKENKKDFRRGADYMMTDSAGVTTIETGTRVNIDALEEQKKAQAQAIKSENVSRNKTYADTQRTGWERTKGFVLSGGAYTKSASEEAAHNIIMETKLDSGEKPH